MKPATIVTTVRIRTVHAVNADGTVDLIAGTDPDTGDDVILTGIVCSSGYPERAPGDTVLVFVGLPVGDVVLAKTPASGWTTFTEPS